MIRALAVVAAIALALAVSCRIPDEHLRVGDAGGSAADAAVDASIDAVPPPCDLSAPWGPVTPVAGLGMLKSVARFSPDEKTAYFALGPNGQVGSDPDTIFVATRADLGSAFGSATELTGVNGSDGESTPSISTDGTTLYYVWGEPPNHTGSDREIYAAKRTGSAFQFGSGTDLSFNAAGAEDDFAFVASNGDVWFSSKRGSDAFMSIYRAASVGGGGFSGVVRQDELNSMSTANLYALLTADLLRVYFQRNSVVFTATRGSAGDDFGIPTTVDELDTGSGGCADSVNDDCRPAWISPDGCRLYLGVGPSGNTVGMYVTSKPPN